LRFVPRYLPSEEEFKAGFGEVNPT
jgi:hypothetical protein